MKLFSKQAEQEWNSVFESSIFKGNAFSNQAENV